MSHRYKTNICLWSVNVFDIFLFSLFRILGCVHTRALCLFLAPLSLSLTLSVYKCVCVCAFKCVVFVDAVVIGLFISKHVVSRNTRRWMIEIVCMCTVYNVGTLFRGNLLILFHHFFFSFIFFSRYSFVSHIFFSIFVSRTACLSSFYFNQLTCVNVYLGIWPLFFEYFHFRLKHLFSLLFSS